ncbi:hypothetical protein BAZMOX_139167_0 [methanotrophic endosymbiont of Bathymodiolus azoricus (Menez Gwen)]|nr:hypothetical protein BAZMOX_139167_0 [methanotrophic endosymbiont of Bathymodiolus azoricus (Menez Gwen)]
MAKIERIPNSSFPENLSGSSFLAEVTKTWTACFNILLRDELANASDHVERAKGAFSAVSSMSNKD